MRKWNAVLSICIIILFLVHAVAGGFQMMGLIPGGSALLGILSWIMVVLILLHTLIGIKLTRDSIVACRKAGVSYFKENKLFWARRISGFSIFAFMLFHVLLFMGKNDGVYRLHYFGTLQLVTQICLVVSMAVHIITNVNPMLISFGWKRLREYAVDILIVLSGILLFTGCAFLIYYLRWNVW